MKKTISVLLSLIMVLAFMPVTAQATATTIETNTLKVSISGGKATASAGDTVTISIKITGELLGNRAKIWLYDPENNASSLLQYMTLNSSSGFYEYSKSIDNKTLSGVWKVYHILALDKSGNTVEIYNNKINNDTPSADLSAGNFTVAETGGDVTGPTVDSTTFKATLPDGKSNVSPGDVVKLSVKATDDSAISSVIVNYRAPKSADATPYDLGYNTTTESFEYLIPITTTMTAGEWTVVDIEATDEWGNTTRIFNASLSTEDISGYLGSLGSLSSYLNGGLPTADLSAGNFTIAGEDGDNTPPEIAEGSFTSTISGGKAKASAGDTVTVSVAVTDVSQILRVAATLESPSGKAADTKVLEMNYNTDTHKYEASFTVDANTASGVWRISSITAIDANVNTVVMHNSKLSDKTPSTDMTGADFEVHNHSYSAVVKAPTCTAKGYTIHTCACGASYKDAYTNATGHKWDKGAVSQKATPTKTGVKTYKCTVCGAEKTATIPKCAKYKNTMTAKGKTVNIKLANLKKKNQVVQRKNAIAVSKAKGKVTYKKASGNKSITVNSAGKITVKKGLKKGTYKVKVTVKAAGNATYKALTKTVTVVITVK